MSANLIGVETLGAVNDGHRPVPARVLAKTISIVMTLMRKIVDEVVYIIREDLGHGRIERDPKSWERD